jgi:hypothetical protein
MENLYFGITGFLEISSKMLQELFGSLFSCATTNPNVGKANRFQVLRIPQIAPVQDDWVA